MELRQKTSPRFKIKTLSKELRRLTFPSSPIAIDLAKFAANAFDKFISGKCASLDEAFEVAKTRGAPRKLSIAKKHLALGKKIAGLRLAGRTSYEIEDKLGMDGGAIRRLYKPQRAHILSRKIDLGLPPRSINKPLAKKESQLGEKERWAKWKKQNDRDWTTYLGSKNASHKPAMKRLTTKKKK